METMVGDLFGLSVLEARIRDHFGLRQVIIVPGDSDRSEFVKKELGRAGAAALKKYLSPHDVVAVAGGSTMAEVAATLVPSTPMKDVLFVPARGGLGETVELQANTIASTMAKRTGGQYRLLHVPDHLGEEAYQTLMQDETIREITEVIRNARIVVHGIGDAMVMARRRKSSEQTLAALQKEGALAEAFGYYFDRNGRVVHNSPTVGLRLEDIKRIEVAIGVAGGRSKGEAIAAVLAFGHEDVLVTDEAAAEEIIAVIERLSRRDLPTPS
jgi:central glycolytic genes regulator